MKLRVLVFGVLLVPASCAGGDSTYIGAGQPWSKRIADSFVLRHPGAVTYDTGFTETKWNYEQGLMLWALYQMSLHSGEDSYLDFVEKNLDQYVEDGGSIRQYRMTDYNLDLVAPGRALLVAHDRTRNMKFLHAADTLREQLRNHPRTKEGGFWHKKIYPYQMWLDGLYMAQPFRAMYARMFNETTEYDDIANQFIWIAAHTRDAATGLYYHAWDESKQMPWAHPVTGCSPSFWGRAMGWYAMGLVDVLEYFPRDHPKRDTLVAILRHVCNGLLHWRDEQSKLWYLVPDQGPREGNYLESSSSSMFIYAFAKGARNGYLGKEFFEEAGRSFEGLLKENVTIDPNGFVNLHNTIKGAGLGGKPYRDGTFAYYTSEVRRTNDIKGVGPFLLAAIELERGL